MARSGVTISPLRCTTEQRSDMPNAHPSPFRDAIERMEEHEIIHRLAAHQFSDEAKPVAEAVLRERGIDPRNPVVPDDQRLASAPPPRSSPWKASLIPIIFGATAASIVGPLIGAALGGAIGAGIVSGLFALAGWWIGSKVAVRVQAIGGRPSRIIILILAVVAWITLLSFVGILVQAGVGRTPS